MAIYNVTLKGGSSEEELAKAKENAISLGGTIQHEFTLIQGFTVQFPDDQASVLESNDKLYVEVVGEVKIQS
ncbi:hypothetical protein MMC29_004367 [Sticta canariensis]|nr:hypothetical protein [Sticta canariensis]